MKRKLFRWMIILATMLSVSTAASFSAFAAVDPDYVVDECWIEQKEDGSIIAAWNRPVKKTSYYVRLLKNGYHITSWKNTKAESLNYSEVINKSGKGTYQVEIYAEHQGFEKRTVSAELIIDNNESRKLTAYFKEKESDAVKSSGGVFDKVDLRITETKVAAGKVRPIVIQDGAYFKVDKVTYSIPFEQWYAGAHVKVMVEILPQKGYTFADRMTVTCSKAESAGISGTGDRRLITLEYIPYEALAKPHLRFATDDRVLYWEKVDKAVYYYVDVLVGQVTVEKHRTTKQQFDFSDYADVAGTTEIRLYANAGTNSYTIVDSTKVVIENLEDYLLTDTAPGEFEAGGIFRLRNGSCYKNSWQKIGQDWYWFDANGRAHGKGWFQDADGSWYYFNDYRRALCSEWVKDADGSWYYFGPDCRMMTNAVTPDGYRVGADGRWIQ